MNNDAYEQYEIIRGRKYRYDPDMDIWYPVYRDMTPWETWSPLIIILVLAVICFSIEYFR